MKPPIKKCLLGSFAGFLSLSLYSTIGCTPGPDIELEGKMIGAWAGSSPDHSWCVNYSSDGSMNLFTSELKDQFGYMRENPLIVHYQGTWRLEPGRRFIHKVKTVNSNTWKNGQMPEALKQLGEELNYSETAYIATEIDQKQFRYVEGFRRNWGYIAERIDACSDIYQIK